jgi:hypothetical protein
MKKVLPLLIIMAALVLAACGGQSTATKWAPTSTKAGAVTPTVAESTAPTAAAAPTATPLPNGCQTVGLLPEPDPAFPDVAKSDWVKGADNAKITILEFSDFQ